MDQTENQRCRNCDTFLPENAKFCPACSQKNTDGRITFKELVSQFMSDLFNLDGRIFQTLKALSVPGKLTDDFFNGKQIRYYHPVRLFIFAGVIFIGVLSLTLTESEINTVDNLWKNREKMFELKKAYNYIDTTSQHISMELGDTISPIAFDTLRSRFASKFDLKKRDSFEISDGFSFGNTKNTKAIKISLEDALKLPEDSLATKYGIKGLWDRQIFLQNLRVQKSASNFLFYLIKNILWMVFIMMPMLALVLKLLYLRKRYLYVEHLVFSFHVHIFFFLLLGSVIFLANLTNAEFFFWIIFLAPLYLLFAMKRFYKQRWWVTVIKFCLVYVFYLAVFTLSVFITAFVSIFLF